MGYFAFLTDMGGEISVEDSAVIKRHRIMSRFHWSYQDYVNTPAHVVAEHYAIILTENKAGKE